MRQEAVSLRRTWTFLARFLWLLQRGVIGFNRESSSVAGSCAVHTGYKWDMFTGVVFGKSNSYATYLGTARAVTTAFGLWWACLEVLRNWAGQTLLYLKVQDVDTVQSSILTSNGLRFTLVEGIGHVTD